MTVPLHGDEKDFSFTIGRHPLFDEFDVEFCLADRKVILRPHAEAASSNPVPSAEHSDAVKTAAKEYEVFVARTPNRVRYQPSTPFLLPRRRLCDWKTGVYGSNKWKESNRAAEGFFFHHWEDGLRRSTYITKNGKYIIAAGPARNTRSGIDDFTGLHRLMRRAKNLDAALRQVKAWAKLATPRSVSLPCAKCGTTLEYLDEERPQRWECPRCHGTTPRYRLRNGKAFYDGKSRWTVWLFEVA